MSGIQKVVMAMAAVLTAASAAPVTTAVAAAGEYSSWSPAVRVEATGAAQEFNGPSLDGCPFLSRDGKTFFMASTRPGGLGGIDIWISTRASERDPWDAPVNAGAPVNSAANDFCPTISRDGHRFFFVSNRPGGCGGDDIFATRLRADGWDPVINLGCDAAGGPNSVGNEASPAPLPERATGPTLYFSSTRAGSPDIYRSQSDGGVFGPAEPVSELNTAAADAQPNLRRDGLEIVFFSNRPGAQGNDIYAATRPSVTDPWGVPVNLGPAVNTAAAETRPMLSWDGTELYFGSTRPGGDGDSDHYVSTRERL